MGIADQLNAMRRDFPACRVVTFADLSSGLVLFTSSSARMAQDRLNALCDRARALFTGPAGKTAATLLNGPVQQAVVSHAEGLLVFVRQPDEPSEALVCHVDPGIDLGAFTARAASELATLGSGS